MTFSPEDFDFLQRLLREEAGLVLEAEKDYLASTRLGRLALEQGDSIPVLLQRARGGDRAMREAIADAMTIQETYFFRDPWFYDSLRNETLPALLQARSAERRLRIWCAACATGQEVYSLRLLLAEHFPQLTDWSVEILATDYSVPALAQAREGSYSQMEVNRGLPAALLARHFTREGLRWRVQPGLREGISFMRLNLMGSWPSLPPFDIVLLRNVLIYFDTPGRQEVLSRVYRQLRRDGRLYMGASESPLGLAAGFEAGNAGRSCYYQLPQTRITS